MIYDLKTSWQFAILFAFCNLHAWSGYAQEEKLPFTLYGKISGIDTGTFEIRKVGANDTFRALVIDSDRVAIRNGTFRITGELLYPHAFYAMLSNGKKRVATEIFFVEAGTQTLVGHFDSLKDKSPEIVSSVIQKEFFRNYLNKYEPISRLYDEYIKEARSLYDKYGRDAPPSESERVRGLLYKHVDSMEMYIYNFAAKYPSSYIGLWLLADRFSTAGYKQIYEKTYSLLSDQIKNTITGKALGYGLN